MALDVLRAAGRQRDATMETVERVIRTASRAYDCGPLAHALLRVIQSGEAERRARFVCETLARLGAVAALVEADSAFAADYARTRLDSAHAHYGFSDIDARHRDQANGSRPRGVSPEESCGPRKRAVLPRHAIAFASATKALRTFEHGRSPSRA